MIELSKKVRKFIDYLNYQTHRKSTFRLMLLLIDLIDQFTKSDDMESEKLRFSHLGFSTHDTDLILTPRNFFHGQLDNTAFKEILIALGAHELFAEKYKDYAFICKVFKSGVNKGIPWDTLELIDSMYDLSEDGKETLKNLYSLLWEKNGISWYYKYFGGSAMDFIKKFVANHSEMEKN